jgi:long-chain acyl-CoA synthetase
MPDPKRLFDCIKEHLEKAPIPDMLAAKENGKWRTYSTREVADTVNKLSVGLLNLGISCGDMSAEGMDKVALLSKNCPQWVMVDLAVQQIGAVLTPVYPTIAVNELEFVLNNAQVKVIFAGSEDLYNKVMSIRNKLPSLREIYTFEEVPDAKNWKELLQSANETDLARVQAISQKIGHEDLATIIYTSGTTGTPKGVMLSHRNILSNVMACLTCLPSGSIKALSFLPLNHIYEKMMTYIYLFNGSPIYYAESMETIADNLREVKPQIFTTVPLLLEKVYTRIMQKGNELTGMKKKLFFWAHELAAKYEINKPMGAWYDLQLSLANKLIFNKWREALGGNIICIVSGGAACQVRLIRIFTAARIPIMEGYGLTETSPVISVNRYEVHDRRFGTVGPLMPGVEVRLAEDGEILCKSPGVMIGYYKRPDLTAEVMEGGWFHTGDIGVLEEGKYLKITDRKKEMFKTSGGKYVAPLPIENKMKESMLIAQIMVVGPERKFVGALIVPNFAHLKEWYRQQGFTATTNEALIHDPRIIALYRETIDKYNQYFGHVEQIKKFELLPAEWSIETGEMTPKLSLKRKVVTEKYRDTIEKIYSVTQHV